MDPRHIQNEEGRRLSGVLALCHAAEIAAAEPLKNPGRSMPAPAWKRLNITLQHARLTCRTALLAVREHRKRMLERMR